MARRRKRLGRAEPHDLGFFLTVAAADAEEGLETELLDAVRLWTQLRFERAGPVWDQRLRALLEGRDPPERHQAALMLALKLQRAIEQHPTKRVIGVEEGSYSLRVTHEGDETAMAWQGLLNAAAKTGSQNYFVRCDVCGRVYKPKRQPGEGEPRYCSTACRTQAYRKRQATRREP